MDILDEVFEIIKDRKTNPRKNSYVGGIINNQEKILEKIDEESRELIESSKDTKKEIVHEASDLIFHTMLLLANKGIEWDEIKKEFEKRHKEKLAKPD